jgi:hypothetical protein
LNEGHHARLLAPDEIANLLRIERLPPILRQDHKFGAMPPRHLADAISEEAIGEQGELLTGLGKIGYGRFHAGASGSRDCQIELILGGIGVPDPLTHLLGSFKKEGIEVPHHGLRHGLVDARRHHARAGPKQQSGRCL